MLKKGFWKLEYSIIVFVIIGLFLLLIPVNYVNTRQAGFIAKWNEKYDKVEYMFTVIDAQITDDILKSFNDAKNSNQRELLLYQLVKPYMRLYSIDNDRYKAKFMVGSRVAKDSYYYFEDLFLSDNGMQIVGIKDLFIKSNTAPWFMMMFDVNGFLPPNTWGKDIFGIYIYDGGRIKAFGAGRNMDGLQQDCSRTGTGVDCSYYYKIGGEFNDK